MTDDGTGIRTYEWNDLTLYKQIMSLKNSNPSLKVYLSIGGWTHGTGAFSIAASSDYNRRLFAANSLEFIKNNKFDGIDIDWEYPGYEGHPSKPGVKR